MSETKTLWTDKHVQDVLDEFDFYRVERVMDRLDWRWHLSLTPPTRPEMAKCARDLFGHSRKAYADGDKWSATTSGGFRAYVDGQRLELSFVATATSYYADERGVPESAVTQEQPK